MSLSVDDTARIDVTLKVDGDLTDPSSLAIEVTAPGSSSATTYTYGTDDEIVRRGVGSFRANIDCTVAGVWSYRWVSAGPIAKGAKRGSFSVTT
jgi:hypothetical protein